MECAVAREEAGCVVHWLPSMDSRPGEAWGASELRAEGIAEGLALEMPLGAPTGPDGQPDVAQELTLGADPRAVNAHSAAVDESARDEARAGAAATGCEVAEVRDGADPRGCCGVDHLHDDVEEQQPLVRPPRIVLDPLWRRR
ncbi:unnamed protein product [Prorocentrum cordatum]|uniref:Uncharacterized protein n=1 Tax=Prorocentrum cordatum TaxID=2364126 RepID=A0ABN9YFS7_9DINO|nr:unnamed protein product [Polarella glacialis]